VIEGADAGIEQGTPRPPYDPELVPFLDLAMQGRPAALDLDGLPALREEYESMIKPIDSIIEGHDLEHVEVAATGPEGAPDVIISIIRPIGMRYPAACIYNIHGGGMVIGNRFLGAEEFPGWIERFGVIVATVEYRLAPEHRHPAPVEDCYAGLVWLAEHADAFGIDPNRIMLRGGSAGAGLAAAVSLMARDRKGPRLMAQMLMCPMLDDRNETISSRQYDNRTIWNRSSNEFGWRALLGDDPDSNGVSPYAAPARSENFADLPPTFIDAGSAEVFRDEAISFASRLWAAGGEAELHIWSGGFHGFEVASHTAVAEASLATRLNWMGRILGP
jgi:acetyl esterase/lipase